MPDWPFKCLKGNICAEGGFPAFTIWWHQLGFLTLTEEESSYISITHLRWKWEGKGNLMSAITFQHGGQQHLTSLSWSENQWIVVCGYVCFFLCVNWFRNDIISWFVQKAALQLLHIKGPHFARISRITKPLLLGPLFREWLISTLWCHNGHLHKKGSSLAGSQKQFLFFALRLQTEG